MYVDPMLCKNYLVPAWLSHFLIIFCAHQNHSSLVMPPPSSPPSNNIFCCVVSNVFNIDFSMLDDGNTKFHPCSSSFINNRVNSSRIGATYNSAARINDTSKG